MPVPMEPTCWQSIWNMAAAFGGLIHNAATNDTWDQTIVAALAEELMDLSDECQLATDCHSPAMELSEALAAIMEKPEIDSLEVRGQVDAVGNGLVSLTQCLYHRYALVSTLNLPEHSRAWPEDDWLAEWKPQRVESNA